MGEFRDWWQKGEPSDAEVRLAVERIMAGGDGEYLLATVEDEPAGVCQVRFRWSVWTAAEDCWLEDLYVRESARRRGAGLALVEAAVERARARGSRRIELDVNERNRMALALYSAAGFSLEPKPPGRTLLIGRRLAQ